MKQALHRPWYKYYSKEEKMLMCQFLIDKLRSQSFTASDKLRPMGHKIWRMAHEEGILRERSLASLSFTCRSQVLPNLAEFVPNPEDFQFLHDQLTYMGVFSSLERSGSKEKRKGRGRPRKDNPRTTSDSLGSSSCSLSADEEAFRQSLLSHLQAQTSYMMNTGKNETEIASEVISLVLHNSQHRRLNMNRNN